MEPKVNSITPDEDREEQPLTLGSAEHRLEGSLNFNPQVYIQRYLRVNDVISSHFLDGQSISLVDFGCAELDLFKYFKFISNPLKIFHVDIDLDLLQRYHRKVISLTADFIDLRLSPLEVTVLAGSVADKDRRLAKCNAVVAIELIEHLHPPELAAVPSTIFEFIQPEIAVITTPNKDFNVVFQNDDPNTMRHDDHKFEWTRTEFRQWCEGVVSRFPAYTFEIEGIGSLSTTNLSSSAAADDVSRPLWTEEAVGCCTQMAIFRRRSRERRGDAQEVTEEPYEVVYHEVYPVDSRSALERRSDLILGEVYGAARTLRYRAELDPEEPTLVPLTTLIGNHLVVRAGIDETELRSTLARLGLEVVVSPAASIPPEGIVGEGPWIFVPAPTPSTTSEEEYSQPSPPPVIPQGPSAGGGDVIDPCEEELRWDNAENGDHPSGSIGDFRSL